jgi:hypothetical protein
MRKRWENHEYVVPVTADFEFLTDARQRFHGHRLDSLYHAWRCGELSEQELRVEFLRLWPERTIFFDTCLVRGHGRPYDLQAPKGQTTDKDNDHNPIHLSVNNSGKPKCGSVKVAHGATFRTRAKHSDGWSDPTGSLWLPKTIVGSLQPQQRKALFAKCFARVSRMAANLLSQEVFAFA